MQINGDWESMKVQIGKYVDFVGPYQIAEFICKPMWWLSENNIHGFGVWLSEDKNGNDSYLTIVSQWLYDKKSRKIKIHIDDYDAWSMHSTLALIILPMLKKLKMMKHGAPGDMLGFQQTSNQAQGSFDFYAEGDETAWSAGQAQWDKIMEEMIWTFSQLQPGCDWEGQYWITRPVLDLSEYPEDEGKICVPVRWKGEGECDWEGRLKHSDRIQAGLEMFGTRFQNLWD